MVSSLTFRDRFLLKKIVRFQNLMGLFEALYRDTFQLAQLASLPNVLNRLNLYDEHFSDEKVDLCPGELIFPLV